MMAVKRSQHVEHHVAIGYCLENVQGWLMLAKSGGALLPETARLSTPFQTQSFLATIQI
jgi:hypothetical protein